MTYCGNFEIKREKFSLFLTEAARYMSLAGDIKEIIPFFEACQLRYAQNLPAVRTSVNNWTSAGLLVSRANNARNVEDLVPD